MPRQLRRRSLRKIAIKTGEAMNFRKTVVKDEKQHAIRRKHYRMGLLGKECGRGQCRAGLIATTRNGNRFGMVGRATILFAEPARRINQAAGSGWQPNERQHQRNHCLDPLHGESNTTLIAPGQCGRFC